MRSENCGRTLRGKIISAAILAAFVGCVGLKALAADWPMWRYDAGRTGACDELIDPDNLRLLWERRLPRLRPAFRDVRLQFDRGYEPVVAGGRMFVASNLDDSVTAYDAATGEKLWKFFTEGPVRFAPVVWKGGVFFGSDDGHLYCVGADDGELLWKFKAVPSNRKLTGNGRIISVWPVRGGPVLYQGRICFAAGVLPFEGVFVYALEAATGKVIWLNDSSGYIYGQQPHDTEAMGGLAPQGYLLVDRDDLVLPCSNACPARFDLESGELKEFKLPKAGRLPGGWFAATPAERLRAKLKRRGLLFDESVNRSRHEDEPLKAGLPGVRDMIYTAGRAWRFAHGLPGVKGQIHTMLAADGKLFAVTLDGVIYAFGPRKEGVPKQPGPRRYFMRVEPGVEPAPEAAAILRAAKHRHGFAVALGVADKAILEGLLRDSKYHLLVLVETARRADELRRYFDRCGPYGRWITVMTADPATAELPPYVANLIVVSRALKPTADQLARWFEFLRPYGGVLVGTPTLLEVARTAKLPGARFETRDDWAVIARPGPLPGATNYLGDWQPSPDERVKAPLGALWFDDSLGHFKRAPQPKIVDGIMISFDKDWRDIANRGGGKDYRLLPPRFSDVYTGHILTVEEVAALDQRLLDLAKVDLKSVQPVQYRPPAQKFDVRNPWASPGQPRIGMRRNPLTGEMEPRVIPKQYGCDGGFDYGYIFTMRSATAAFYDKRMESGPIYISGPRSGCTNSIIPAAGVLNVPYFYEGCTCSYPLPVGLALVSQPQTYEQWTAWGPMDRKKLAGKVQRVGINLGAPGDRVTDDGTLWLEFSAKGGASPDVPVELTPPEAKPFYRHSLWIAGGTGWPWVAASGIEGIRRLSIKGVKPGRYLLRLVFAEPANKEVGQRTFDVLVQGKVLIKRLDVVKEAGGRMRALTKTLESTSVGEDGQLLVQLHAVGGQPILSGVELVRHGLQTGEPIVLDDKETRQLWHVDAVR